MVSICSCSALSTKRQYNMIRKICVFVLCMIVGARCSIIPTVNVLQGPGSKTTLIGPDGSALSSRSPGGTVAIDGSGLIPAGPALLGVGAPIAVRGPAGAVITANTLAGPAVVPALGAGVVAASGAGVWAGGIGADLDDNGHQGAWIPDTIEGHDGSWGGHW